MTLHKLPYTTATAVFVDPTKITAIHVVASDGRLQTHTRVHIDGAHFVCLGDRADELVAWVQQYVGVAQ
jgi:hypothetical protein